MYRACLKLLPHSSFTFAKVWLLAAQLELRQLRLDAARKILGMALGMCPKNKLFKGYINIELQLGNIDRCVRGGCSNVGLLNGERAILRLLCVRQGSTQVCQTHPHNTQVPHAV